MAQRGGTQQKACLGLYLNRCSRDASGPSEATRQPLLLCGSSHTAGTWRQLFFPPGAHASVEETAVSHLTHLRQQREAEEGPEVRWR